MSMSTTTVEKSLPPATPRYILRGHASAIQALHFFAHNTRLISADADGWVVIWDVITKRTRAVWKAHEGAVLEVKGFELPGQGQEIFTHGRDHKLRLWRIKASDDEQSLLNRVLPVERTQGNASSTQTSSSVEPWLVHSLPVNALNFCAFALCLVPDPPIQASNTDSDPLSTGQGLTARQPVYFAVPNALNSGAIDIFHLPSEKRVSTILADTVVQTGMVMAVNLLLTAQNQLYVLSGYEDGHVMVHVQRSIRDPSKTWKWENVYVSRPHSQPVLSLDSVQSDKQSFFFTSSADALIVKHPVPAVTIGSAPAEKSPLKLLNTKHAGQQGLRVRTDQKIFGTAGWDARVRVYSCKTMRELGVLKWHKEGCYAVAFADILSPNEDRDISTGCNEETDNTGGNNAQTHPSHESPLQMVQHQRSQKAQQMHWLAAGSKDGKISLWDIY
ncbi:ASTRA-associated protein 1 [Talaromyces islandicus]|uniref:ASTRA-associated protein 1 n=1 Tax=Talaromyces islandicus TaxID=28573 RepID=A0A0U1LMQ3_TALIS|nr:ASTRA-associated protein 1 [Talaromyces islandicus]